MLKRMSRFARAVRLLPLDDRGNISVMFAAVAVPLIAAGGAAVDYGLASVASSRALAALDGAVLAGVTSSIIEDHMLAAATKYYAANKPSDADLPAPEFFVKNGRLTGSLAGEQKTYFLGIVGVEKIRVGATSTATAEVYREPACIMAMHPTRKHTLELKDQVSLYGLNCHIYGNSDHFNDVVDPHTPDNFITARSVAAVGGGHHYLENVTPPVEFGHEIIPDPFDPSLLPPPGACVGNSIVVDGQTTTLAPGHYCGGLEIKNSNVTLQAGGIYHITGGDFMIDSSTVTGDQVTIFLQGGAVEVNWVDSEIRLKAKVSGQYKGIAVFGQPIATTNTFENSTIDIHGVFYMPRGDFTWTSNGTPAITAKWTAFVTDGFSWMGNGTINFPFDLAGSDVPYPEELRVVPRPGKPRLIK